MKIFDFHTHIYPDKIAAKATQSVSDFYEIETPIIGTVDTLFEEGKKAGIEKYLVLPVAIRADQVVGINNFIHGQVQEHEEFYGFGTVHADMPDICQEVERIREMGLLGIKMHPDTQMFNIDDERLFPMYDLIQGKIPVMLHTGDPRYDYSHPRRLRRVLEMFPKLTAIAAHFGGWSVFEEAYECLHDKECYMDVSSSIMFLGKEKSREYICKYGAERMLFGSDFPLWKPSEEVRAFMELDLTSAQQEMILYDNAMRLVGEKK